MTLEHSTPDNTDLAALKAIAAQIAGRCPDVRQLAADIASRLLIKHTGRAGNPDDVWWHRWKNADSNPRSFTGWEHWGRPVQSMTLPQLVMHRFEASDQDNADNLKQMGGFYSAGPEAHLYNESNEVRLMPADVLNDLWGIDFAQEYRAKLDHFWAEHADDFRLLAKANYLAKALEDRQALRLSDGQFQIVVKAVAGDVQWPVTLATLRAEVLPSQTLKVYAFDISGRLASDILRIVDQDGWQYLYVPGEVTAFHAFERPQDLYWWVLSETNMAQNRARFLSHWPLSDSTADPDDSLNHTLDLLFYGWGHNKSVNKYAVALSEDPFTFLRHSTEQRMYADMDLSLTSNADLRKQMWIGYLNAFSRVAGGMAALDWPVALALVGSGLSDMGLNIDQAVNGHTTAQRRAGVLGAITSAIDTLFNALFLWPAGSALADAFEPLEARVELAEIKPLLPAPLAPLEAAEALAPLETNELLEGQLSAGQGRMRGVYLNEAGQTHIQIDEMAYQVRWVKDLNCWAVVDPANPFSFYGSVPVRLDVDGVWQPMATGGLKGGGGIFGKKPWGRAVAEVVTALTPTFRYDVPVSLRERLRNMAQGLEDKLLSGERANLLQPGEIDPYEQMRSIRQNLRTDAEDFLASFRLPPRPSLPLLDSVASEPTLIKAVYGKANGMVIGESHASIASKKFLIDNMALLAKQRVRTLFMEHLLTDYHQVDLDTYARTGTLPEGLQTYLERIDRGFHTDPQGRYTFLELVRSANQHHIRIQALDCAASYRQAGLSDAQGNVRTQMLNYFAHTVIQSDQAIRGSSKWVALVGNTHANTFRGVPGISELEGAIGIRVEDVASNAVHGVRIDAGRHLPDLDISGSPGFVKSDLHYEMGTLTAERDLDQQLNRPGLFTLDTVRGSKQLVHRSGDGSLVYTPIKRAGAFIYIERPKWPSVHGRRFNSTSELITALTLTGMKHVG